jgi:UDP:flavonoid glycosyltransferase YjiC (YdhE family)
LRILLTTFHGGGNVPPFVELSRELHRRGHDVTVLAQGSLRQQFDSVGSRFVESQHGLPYTPYDRIPLDVQYRLFGAIFFDTGHGDDLLDQIEATGADVVVADCHLYGAIAAAEASRRPLVVLVHTLFAFMHRLAAGNLGTLQETRRRWTLPPVSPEEIWRGATALLVTSFSALDEPQAVVTPITYTGPLFDEGDPAAEAPAGDGVPHLLVSLSTTYMQHEDLLMRIIDALAEAPVQATVTVGAETDLAAGRLPPNVSLRAGWAPHAQLIAHSAGVICHAGHGIVSTSLALGRPVLCIPLGRDQPYIGQRVVHIGAGLLLPGDAPSPAIRRAALRLIEEPALAERAAELAASAPNFPPRLSRAADLVEEASRVA